MEKHWRSVINKSICDYFFEAQEKVILKLQIFHRYTGVSIHWTGT